MVIIGADTDHLDDWATLRAALWPDETIADHRREIAAALIGPAPSPTWLALIDGEVVALIEASLRSDYVNGCDTSPVAFVEGIYVVPHHRRRGIARALVDRVAEWGRSAGASELASDALLDNPDSHQLHAAIGFEETERVVFFRRPLA